MAPLSRIDVQNQAQYGPIVPKSLDDGCTCSVTDNDTSSSCVCETTNKSKSALKSSGPLTPKEQEQSGIADIEGGASATKKCLSPRRKVSFASTEEVRPVTHLNDLSEDDLVAVWWTPNDFRLIKKMYHTTIRMIMDGHTFSDDDEDFCLRGLESRTTKAGVRGLRQQISVRKAVLKAQNFQLREGFTDASYIAELYAEYSRSFCEAAHARALLDAKV